MHLKLFILALTAGLCAACVGCASTGPPLPPSLELPKPPNDLRARRKGDRVSLTWTIPAQTTDRQSVRYLGPTRICRAVDRPLSQCDPPVGEAPKLQPDTVTLQAEGKKIPQQYVDLLPAALMKANPLAMATYAVEVYNRDRRGGGISNQVRIPLAPTYPPPSDFQGRATADGILLSWQGLAESTDVPQIMHRYRIYRRELDPTKSNSTKSDSAPKEVLAGDVAVEEAGPVQYLDHTFQWDKTYLYRLLVVTVVSTGFQPCPATAPSGADCMGAIEIEGDDTPDLKVSAQDTFPPAVPNGLQAVFSGPGQQPFVDLAWAPSVQEDLAGYNIYRHEAGQPPVKVNSELAKTPAYRDTAVSPGIEYFYAVSSVDARGNESAHSEEASERVPQ
jgi:hypothetical protein